MTSANRVWIALFFCSIFCSLDALVLDRRSSIRYMVDPTTREHIEIKIDPDWQLVSEKVTDRQIEVSFVDRTGYEYAFQVTKVGDPDCIEKVFIQSAVNLLQDRAKRHLDTRLIVDDLVQVSDSSSAYRRVFLCRDRYSKRVRSQLQKKSGNYALEVQFSPAYLKLRSSGRGLDLISRVLADQMARITLSDQTFCAQ